MHAEDVLALILGIIALALVATSLGAVLMWRWVHEGKHLRALPVWVPSLAVGGGAMWIAAGVVAGQQSIITSGILTSIGFVIQLVQSLRHRTSGGA